MDFLTTHTTDSAHEEHSDTGDTSSPHTQGRQTAKAGETRLHTISVDSDHLHAEILNYGARLVRLMFDGTDVVLRLPDIRDYCVDTTCMGGIIGRVANRIHPAQCAINGRTYQLARNDGENNNHSGPNGFENSWWTIDNAADDTADSTTCGTAPAQACLRLISPDMSQGFPGTLDVRARYTLEESALVLDLTAVSDTTTVCSMTSHTYWNLDGDGTNVLDDLLSVDSDSFFPADDTFIPLGPRGVDGTHFDLRGRHQPLWKALGLGARQTGDGNVDVADFRPEDLTDPLLTVSRGYNHAFDFTRQHRRHPEQLIAQAEVTSPRSGIRLRVSSTAPSLLVYTAGFFEPDAAFPYPPFAGLALEPGFVPNAVNETFGGRIDRPLLPAGERCHLRIRYDFSHI